MELFPDGHHVRLRSRVRDGCMYLYADKDGVGVCLSRERASLHAAWQVHRVVRNGVTYVLLLSGAYGRYLKATDDPAPLGYSGERVVQGVYDDADDDTVAWVPVMCATGGDNNNNVHLWHKSFRYCRWRTGVSVDVCCRQDTLTLWVVEDVPPRLSTPIIPYPSEPHPAALCNWFYCCTGPAVELRRIRIMLATGDGSVDTNCWHETDFDGRSVYHLRSELERELAEADGSLFDFKLCVRAGNLGRLISLVADLPRNEEPVDVVLLPYWSRTIELPDPNVDV